jgi:hypothetical protein
MNEVIKSILNKALILVYNLVWAGAVVWFLLGYQEPFEWLLFTLLIAITIKVFKLG